MLKFSTYEKAFDELLENEGLKKKAAKSGISYGTLKKVYNRGMAAWRTGHRPGTTPQQWGMARVNSYIGKGKGTYYGADADLRGAKRKTKKEALDDKDKSTVKDVIKGLKKAVNIHKSQAASLTKDIKDDVQVKEISKGLAKRYVGKAARDVYFKGRSQATKDAISQLGGPDTDYKKSPERKAAMRMRGIDRATKRLANSTIVDPRDLRGRPKKPDPNPETKYGIKHPLHPANLAKKKKIKEGSYKVSIAGLPDMYMDDKTPGQLLQKLRKIVKQPSMIQDVERTTDAKKKKAFRQKAQGREVTEYKYDYGTPESVKMMKKQTPGQSEGVRGKTDAPKGPESYEAQYKRRLVKTTDPEHKEKGYNYRIKGKKNSALTKKLYKKKPDQGEFNKQMKRIAGHEFG